MVMTECCERGAALWNFIKLTEPEPEQLPKPETHNSLILVRSHDIWRDEAQRAEDRNSQWATRSLGE